MWDHAREGADASALRSRTAMADDYGRLYRRVQRRRRALVARESDEPAHVDLLVAGRGHRHPGSVQVRTLRRWQHPTFRRHVDATATTAHDLLDPRRPDPDLLYVQRTAVSPHMVGDVLRHARERDVPVVFDIDDDLLSDELAADPAWSGQQDAARQLLRSADLVTVSTAALADRLAQHVAGRVAVLPNQLDERLWFPSGTAVETTADRAPSSPLRLLYAGSPTHGADLAMLRDLVAAAGVDVTLTVIGGEPDDGASSWYERLVVPGPSKNYPQYVQFLQQHRNQFDAAVAPLVDTPFNRCKSDLKFLEYSALGLPSVFSRVGPYADAIDDGVTGLLADNTVEAWRKALDEIAGDVEAAARMAQQAHTHVRSCRTVQGHGDGHRELILSLLR